jgi:hypothetical protein
MPTPLELVRYSTERPHLGYRYQGRRPLETIKPVRQPRSLRGHIMVIRE